MAQVPMLMEVRMSPKRILPMAVATLGLGLGFVSSVAPASAAPTICWTVFRAAPIYSTAGGRTQTGTASVGDTFENINGIVQGGWRYGVDDTSNSVTGWISNGDLTHGFACE